MCVFCLFLSDSTCFDVSKCVCVFNRFVYVRVFEFLSLSACLCVCVCGFVRVSE